MCCKACLSTTVCIDLVEMIENGLQSHKTALRGGMLYRSEIHTAVGCIVAMKVGLGKAKFLQVRNFFMNGFPSWLPGGFLTFLGVFRGLLWVFQGPYWGLGGS